MEDNTKLVKRKKKRIHKPIIVAMSEIILAIVMMSVIVTMIVVIKGMNVNTTETETIAETEIELETETETEIVEVSTQKEVETEIQTETEVEPTSRTELVSMGTFTITAYCSCEICCSSEWANNRPLDEYGNPIVYGASGEVLVPDYSIATDVEVIPYGETILINDQEYVAHDCGAAIQGNRIDIYMSCHEKALEWGVQNIEIFREVTVWQ